MNKLIILTGFLISLLPQLGAAQNLIAVQNGGVPAFYTKLDSAMVHAQNGDTIYISGGPYNLTGGSLIIAKELHIIGAGHHPDSTSATNMTKLFGSIFFAIKFNTVGLGYNCYINNNVFISPSTWYLRGCALYNNILLYAYNTLSYCFLKNNLCNSTLSASTENLLIDNLESYNLYKE